MLMSVLMISGNIYEPITYLSNPAKMSGQKENHKQNQCTKQLQQGCDGTKTITPVKAEYA